MKKLIIMLAILMTGVASAQDQRRLSFGNDGTRYDVNAETGIIRVNSNTLGYNNYQYVGDDAIADFFPNFEVTGSDRYYFTLNIGGVAGCGGIGAGSIRENALGLPNPEDITWYVDGVSIGYSTACINGNSIVRIEL